MSQIILDVTKCSARELIIVNDAIKSLNKAVASINIVNVNDASIIKHDAVQAIEMVDTTTDNLHRHFF